MVRILLNYHWCISLSYSSTYLLNIIVVHDVMCWSFCLVPEIFVRSCLGWVGVACYVRHGWACAAVMVGLSICFGVLRSLRCHILVMVNKVFKTGS